MNARANEYHFITRWQVEGSVHDVFDIISQPLEYPHWWPSVYLKVKQIADGDEDGVGRRVRLHTKGWLPYTLIWESTVMEIARPAFLMIRASGDFDGRGIWTLKQEGKIVDVTFDWKLAVDKPLLRTLSFLLKPVFSANHVWAMKQGEKSLNLEIARRNARTSGQLRMVPRPPGPNTTSIYWLSLGAIAAIGLVAVLLSAMFR
jgi:hypothetical protein